jgi:ADP-heptose:LPS heptosyltransferase
VGAGDNIMATGLARGAAKRGKRIAFGDGRKIIWDQFSESIFRHNPNIAKPGTERQGDVEWIEFYKGKRLYNRASAHCWEWNYQFSPKRGEIFFNPEEVRHAEQFGSGYVVIEPNIPAFKSVAPNKQWPIERYEEIARRLTAMGYQVVQFGYGGVHRLKSASLIATSSFRQALANLARAALYIGPEGGMHHGAAADKCTKEDKKPFARATPAVVLFGGFIPPQVTGYECHTNLTGGAQACGSHNRCQHCLDAMRAITVDQVHEAALRYLEKVST